MTAELVCAATNPAWLERRREGITATDIVTIAGLVTWDSPWALYHRKLGLLPEVEQSDRMRLGSWLEGAIADEWNDWASKPYSSVVRKAGLYRNQQRPWQMATPDRITYDAFEGPGGVKIYGPVVQGPIKGVLECKTWDERQGKAEWGPDGSDQMPAKVRAQVLWQMDTLAVGTGHVAVVFLPSGEFRSYTIRHASTCTQVGPLAGCSVCDEVDGLRDLGFGFWSRILRREPPDLDGLEVTTDALRYLHPAPSIASVTLDDDYGRRLMDKYDEIGELRRVTEIGWRKTQNQIRELMGDAHEATRGGHVVFRRTIGKRAGYTVPPGETDVLRRIGKDKHDDSS